MKRILKSMIALLLALCMMSGAAVSVFAKDGDIYISELRLIYADSYREAEQILSGTKLEGFEVLNQNLNSGSGEIGVWLAYKTTDNVNEAITDIAVMQMGGGYSAGNYRELIKSIQEEYAEMGEIYLQAAEYFMNSYESDSFLARAAYRQLNFYSGLDNYEDDRLGDLIVNGDLTSLELATLFLQGNPYVLKNIRTLFAMGVSYNEDGKHYLEKVGEAASKMNEYPSAFEGEVYDELASLIAPNILTFRNMFCELSAYEDELDYEDDEITELEIKYSEYKAIADMMRSVSYLGEDSLYEFCSSYTLNIKDYTSLYPLVDALNEGQVAMTMLSHYCDVVRYSLGDAPEELIDEEILKLEELYGDTPIYVYSCVDRSIYEESFALTGDAYRADSYYDTNSLTDALFGDVWMMKDTYLSSSAIDVGLSVWSIKSTSNLVSYTEKAESTSKMITRYTNIVRQITNAIGGQSVKEGPFIDSFIKKYTVYDLFYDFLYNYDKNLPDSDWTFEKLTDCLKHEIIAGGMTRSDEAKALLKIVGIKMDSAKSAIVKKAPSASKTMLGISAKFTTLFNFLDTSILATSAIALGVKVYDHYYPEYDAVPTSMVDVINTDIGDVYVKYDVVCEAMSRKDGKYHAADLNAFEGQRWNALYYTKNEEAGKPLLADFELSNMINRADNGYLAVHRFGETVCYDLNKYNFSSSSDNIYLSVAQSDNMKSSEIEVPDVVGTMFGTGFWIVSGSVGVMLGIMCAIGTKSLLLKKKKRKIDDKGSEAK